MTVLHGMLFKDLEFASVIVQKLNIILITSPELADFRRRLKNLETRVCRLHEHTALTYKSSFHSARWSSLIYNVISFMVP